MGLAAFAAAAISRGDPIRTGIQGFSYDIRTAVLPFMFIFNTDILLIDVTFLDGVIVFIASVAGMLAFCSAVQHYMFVRNRIWESLLLLVIAFSMFRPDFWQDRVSPPYIEIPGHEVLSSLGDDGPNGLAGDQRLRVQLSGPDFDDADRILQRNAILELDLSLIHI